MGHLETWASSEVVGLAAIVAATIKRDTDQEPGLEWLLRQYREPRFGRADLFDFDQGRVRDQLLFCLTMKGWSLYEEISRRKPSSKKSFYGNEVPRS